jgi:ABC-2 type transport system ATP-binding protein
MSSDEPIIRIENLFKSFYEVRALDDVSLTIHPGRIVGLVGANGGGKSTLLRTIVGLYLPDKGSCTTFGREAGKLRPEDLARIGYVHQEGELIDWMTVDQMVRYVAAYYPGWNADLEERYRSRFDVDGGRRVGVLSPGERQKLAILLAIGFEPELLILDEPAAALDPIARQRFLDLLLDIIQDEGRTILISSHILSDIEKVIDHVLILDRGAILRDRGFDELREEFNRVRLTSLNGPLPDELRFEGLLACERSGAEALLTLRAVSRPALEAAAGRIHCAVETLPLAFEEIYRLVIEEERREPGAER